MKDASGDLLPGARITIRHVDTGRVLNTTANAEGFFVSPPLNIGLYKMRVEASGMKAWEGELALETGRVAAVEPVVVPGQVTETVMVTDTVPLVNVVDATEASTLDSQRIQDLPSKGRNLNTLLGNVTPGGCRRRRRKYPRFRPDELDVAAANNREFGGSANLPELASYALKPAPLWENLMPTSVIVSTKSGSNRSWMPLFETQRQNGFGAARARQDVFLDGRPFQTRPLIRNEFLIHR